MPSVNSVDISPADIIIVEVRIAVTILTSLGVERLKNRGLIPERARDFLSSPQRRDQLWGQPTRLSKEYRSSFPEVKGPERETHNPSPSATQTTKYMALYIYSLEPLQGVVLT
jgi:hypothetical protein